ncbi:MAG: transposase [Thermoguttaceae bacterium]
MVMYSTPIGYFLTFTVRGSWRHGDSRGSWRRNGIFISPTERVNAAPNRNQPHIFTEEERRVIEMAINEICEERKWELHAINVRINHVHVVLTAEGILPENVMQLLKSKATMYLRKSGFVAADEKIWTQHGSTKNLFDERALQTTCEYVRNQ